MLQTMEKNSKVDVLREEVSHFLGLPCSVCSFTLFSGAGGSEEQCTD